ncbi:MAG: hypothetical protein ACYSTY_10605 [Planctomycetota bacterium]|jgi:hypothetical protein
MDRQRLQQVHQSEITESRINEDFVEWLKTKAPQWLLAILIGIAAYMAIVRWKEHKTNRQDAAWQALVTASLPGAKEDVADEHGDVFAVAQLAWLQAAQQLLRAIDRNMPLGADANDTTVQPLTPEQRDEYLDRIAGLCQKVLLTDTSKSLPMTLHAVNALKTLAAAAEARGEFDEARRWYEEAAERAELYYPNLAEQSRRRGETVDQYTRLVSLPPPALVAVGDQTSPGTEPAPLEPALRGLLLPDENVQP